MNKYLKQFKEEAKTINLTTDEKLAMEERLSLFMNLNPFPEKASVSPFWERKYFKYSVPATLAIVIFATTSLSVAAESTLPGDILYPIKINVNEKLSETFAFSEEAKINKKIDFTERRLQEAQQILTGPAPDETQVDIITEQLNSLTTSINEFADTSISKKDYETAAETTANLHAVLDAYDDLLLTASSTTTSEEVKQKVQVLQQSVIEQKTETKKNTEEAVERLKQEHTTDQDSDTLQQRAAARTELAQEHLRDLIRDFGLEVADDKVQDIADRLLESEKAAKEARYAESFVAIQEAEKLIKIYSVILENSKSQRQDTGSFEEVSI